MHKLVRLATAVVVLGMLSACISPRAYVDPQYRLAGYESIQRLPTPVAVNLSTQFQRNGEHLPGVDAELRGHVERTLRASGVFTPTADANAPVTLSVTANNIADVAAAAAKGFGTGLTFGAAGSMVHDNYEFTFSYRNARNQQTRKVYQHAIHTTIGNADGPPGMTPTNLADAFSRVVEDVVLNFVKEVQDQGLAAR